MALPWPDTPPTPAQREAFADAIVRPYWLDALPAREPRPPLAGAAETDLCIVGGGFTGLWAALHAKADDPSRDVVVLEAETVGFGASGRNGGFAHGSLTHGIENGLARFAEEMPQLTRLSSENFAGFVSDLERLGVECDLELTGDLGVALEPHEVGWLEETAELLGRYGHEHELFDEAAVRAEVASPTYLGGLWDKTDAGLVDPGKLAVGLAEAALAAGVRIHERTPATGIEDDGAGVRVLTEAGYVRAAGVVLATSAYPPLLRAIRRYVVPVYDYVLMTEPLTPEQRESIGWKTAPGGRRRREPVPLLPVDRRTGGSSGAATRRCTATAAPSGPTSTTIRRRSRCSRSISSRRSRSSKACASPTAGAARSTRAAGSRSSSGRRTAAGSSYAVGYTGLGVVSTRFGARVALDLLDGRETEATRLRYVRSKPVPFPPEPLRCGVVQFTRNRLAAADRNAGRRGLWLRTLDRLGLGFDS